jgi:hypothetical protein
MERVTKELARRARAHVRPIISKGIPPGFGSKRLAANVEIRPGVRTARIEIQRLYIDHYWAFYVHEGRGPAAGTRRTPRNAKVFVWFKNPANDPRLAGDPKRFSAIRKLTPAEFKDAKAAGQLVIQRYISKGVPGSPFFSNDPGGGMQGFLDTSGGPLVTKRATNHIKTRLKPILNIKKRLRLI